VITAGAWATQMLASLKIPLVVRRKSFFWFASETVQYDSNNGFPVFLFEIARDSPGISSHGSFYGFPRIDNRGVKFAEHTGGRSVNDPLAIDRSVDRNEQ
jgi:hypothetical protein